MDPKQEFQELQDELEDIQDRIDDIDDKLAEAHELKNALEELKEVEAGKEALVPLSSGVFLQATLENTSTLHVNVGGGAVVEKDIDETQAMVDDHLEELRAARSDVEQDYTRIVERADELSEHMHHV
ncbi:MAG: prefoldin subunit alpha [Halobacteriaceae archaeon]